MTKPSLKDISAKIATATTRVKHNMAVRVVSYHIDPQNEKNSFVQGVDLFNDNKPVFVKFDPNSKATVSIAGFHKPIENDPKVYNVPVNGAILFDDVVPIQPFNKDLSADNGAFYTASWARSAIRVKNQGLSLNYTTIRVSDGSNGKDSIVAFDSYNPTSSKVIDLSNAATAMQSLEAAISKALNPMLGPTGNTSISLLRIYSDDPSEKPVCTSINAFKADREHCSGEVAFTRYKNSEQGKILLDTIQSVLIGGDFKAEVTQGMRYFLSPKGKQQFMIESDDPLKGKVIDPKSFLGGLAKQLQTTEKVQNANDEWVTVSKPRLMELFLHTSTLDDGGKIVTSFTTKSSKTPTFDLSELPSKAIAPLLMQEASPPQETQNTEEAEMQDDPHNNLDSDEEFELSEEDMAALSTVASMSKSM
jgi:hypothetical protein